MLRARENKDSFKVCDLPESLGLLQEAPEQLGQDQEQELLKQLKEQHQSVVKTAMRQRKKAVRKDPQSRVSIIKTCGNLNWVLLSLLDTANILLRSGTVLQFPLFRYFKALRYEKLQR